MRGENPSIGAERPGATGPSGFVAMVLAGGAGTRLRDVVADRPKPLAAVEGTPFVQRLLTQLEAAGCRRVVLCTGHMASQFATAFGTCFGAMELVHSVEVEPLGTAGALRLGREHLGAAEGALVLNGDSCCGVSLAEFVAWARQQAPMAALVAAQVEDAGRYGRLALDADGRVFDFGEKTTSGPGAINAGIYWLPRAALAAIGDDDTSLERQVLPRLVATGLVAFRTPAPFLDIGIPADYARAGQFFAELERREQRRLLVVDRDGTLIVERHYLCDPAAVELLPGVVEGLRRFRQLGYQIAIVSNQSGVGRGYFDHAAMTAVNDEVLRQLAIHGVQVQQVLCCTHRPDDGCTCRKPEPAMLDVALRTAACPASDCLVVGDKSCDVDLGRRRGARTALVRTGYGRETELERRCEPDVVVDDLEQLAALETNR